MNIYDKAINTARYLSACAISNAGSGHTGACVGGADILFTLMHDHLFFKPNNPNFENRDRVVLSAGHVVPLYYSLLTMFGFDVSMDDLRNLRKYGSKTPGHPEIKTTSGIDCSTGALGQGIANAVGLAIAAKYQAAVFNTISMQLFDNYTYCYTGDGCLCEGVALEAISLAGKLKLNKLILLYDCNEITLDGDLSDSNDEDIELKFKAQNWNVIKVLEGNNYKKITKAIELAKKSTKPTIIIFKTKMGYLTEVEGKSKAHSLVMDKEQLLRYKQVLKVDVPDFCIPDDVLDFCKLATIRNKEKYNTWHENFFLFEKTHPELFKLYNQFMSNKTLDCSKILPADFNIDVSGRDANNEILNAISKRYTNLIGGSADLSTSTKVFISGSPFFDDENPGGRNIRYGVREHGMIAINNGIALYGGFIPFGSTFLSFSNYFLPALRMGAIMGLNELVFLTHDGLLVGQDGPTHQPVEQIVQLRAMPNVSVYRPGTVSELLASYSLALTENNPSVFVLSKRKMLPLQTSYKEAQKGAYIIEQDEEEVEIVIYSSGIDLQLAYKIKNHLSFSGIKSAIVSVPSFSAFEKQPQLYKKQTLMLDTPVKVVIEATNDNIWHKYLGNDILFVSSDKYGKSAEGEVVYQKHGFVEKTILKKIYEFLNKK